MKKILIVRTGGTFPEYREKHKDFEHWTAEGMGLSDAMWHCVNVQAGETLPEPEEFAGAAVTGSHDMVTDDADWIRHAGDWVARAVDAGLPLLGICFGHQLMADALGGRAGYHPDGVEMGTADVVLTEEGRKDVLLSGLPPVFKGHVTHSQTALELPPGAVLLATGSHDPHQCFRVGRHAWGVQFHPEFDAAAIRYYLDRREDILREAGRDVAAIRAAVCDTPESASLLERFAVYCRDR
ncbi:MAG: glutamine amidotransferase [Desulfovibrionaceae bacterium]|nr:glutamine amidotransferase [Desulfovibrionaceae bacterium]